MRKLSLLVARLKDRFATKITVPSFSPAICPACGVQIEVPLLRTPMQFKCQVCETWLWAVGMGLINTDKNELKYTHNEVVNHIRRITKPFKETHLH